MKDSYIVYYNKNERSDLFEFLKQIGLKKFYGMGLFDYSCCFPICVNIADKTVQDTNTLFLQEYHNNGGKVCSVNDFKELFA